MSTPTEAQVTAAMWEVYQPIKHSQLCPIWRERKRNPAPTECDCWARRHAVKIATAVLEAS